MDIILYTTDNVKHRFIAHKKNLKEFEQFQLPNPGGPLAGPGSGRSKSVLSRFGHLRGKSVKLTYFVDPGNNSKKILLKLDLL